MARLPRVYAVVDQETVDVLDADAEKLKINRSQWILQAIKAYLHVKGDEWIKEKATLQDQLGDANTELSQLKKLLDDTNAELKAIKSSRLSDDTEVTRLRTESEQQKTELERASSEVTQLKQQLDQFADLQNDFDQLKRRYDQSLSDATQRWEETKALKSEITKLKKLLEESHGTIQHLKDDLLKRQSETDLLVKTREELIAATTARDKLQEAIKVRDDDIAFLRGHLSQLSEKLPKSLPPSEEEAKKKGWISRLLKRG
jgi:chromosome segregation ATPase